MKVPENPSQVKNDKKNSDLSQMISGPKNKVILFSSILKIKKKICFSFLDLTSFEEDDLCGITGAYTESFVKIWLRYDNFEYNPLVELTYT